MMRTKRTRLLLATAVSLLLIVLVPATEASASHPAQGSNGACPGKLVGSYPLKAGDTKIGELVIYWYEAGGYNCARLNHVGPTYGESHPTSIELHSCQQTSPAQVCTIRSTGRNSGNFAYYAGRVFVHARDRCVAAHGSMTYGGREYYVNTNPYATHCS